MSFFTENQIWDLLFTELDLWEATYQDDVVLKRSFQPTLQSTPSGFFAYLFQINNKRYGWQSGKDFFNTTTQGMEHTENYIVNKTLQVSTQAITKVTAARTAGDVAESIAAWFNSQETIARLKTQEIEILRITDVRHPHFVNDMDNYEADPSFDFIISYTQQIQTVGVAVDNITGKVFNECTLPSIP